MQKLIELGACKESIIWVKKQESLQAAWENCNNFEWLHWLLNQLGFAEQILSLRVAYNAAVAPAWAAYDAATALAWAAYNAAIAPAEVAYDAAIAQAWAAYCDAGAKAACNAALAQAWAAYDAAVAPARAAYYAAIAPAEVACSTAIDPINSEFCNKLRSIISFKDVLKLFN